MREKLNNENINRACEKAGEFLEGGGCGSKELLRIKFSIEEVLTKYRELLGPEAEFVMDTGSGLGRNRIRLVIPGEEATLSRTRPRFRMRTPSYAMLSIRWAGFRGGATGAARTRSCSLRKEGRCRNG